MRDSVLASPVIAGILGTFPGSDLPAALVDSQLSLLPCGPVSRRRWWVYSGLWSPGFELHLPGWLSGPRTPRAGEETLALGVESPFVPITHECGRRLEGRGCPEVRGSTACPATGIRHGWVPYPSLRERTTRAGFPATKQFGGTSFVTTAAAPTTEFSPIDTPLRIIAALPIQQLLPMWTGAHSSRVNDS